MNIGLIHRGTKPVDKSILNKKSYLLTGSTVAQRLEVVMSNLYMHINIILKINFVFILTVNKLSATKLTLKPYQLASVGP